MAIAYVCGGGRYHENSGYRCARDIDRVAIFLGLVWVCTRDIRICGVELILSIQSAIKQVYRGALVHALAIVAKRGGEGSSHLTTTSSLPRYVTFGVKCVGTKM